MNPARIDFAVDLVYGVLIFAAIGLILVVGTNVGVAFGLGVLVAYVVHIGWKMSQFDPEWMTREVTEQVTEEVSEEVEETVEDTVNDTVGEEIDEMAQQVEETVGEEVTAEMEETVNQQIEETVSENVDEVIEQLDEIEERTAGESEGDEGSNGDSSK